MDLLTGVAGKANKKTDLLLSRAYNDHKSGL